MTAIVERGAAELVRMMAAGELSAADVLEAHLARIAERNGAINAVVTLDADGARRRAHEADAHRARGEPLGALHGLPMTVKDTWLTAGLATSMGVPWETRVPTHDAALVRRLIDAGANVFGKTNLPFAGYDWQCANPRCGRCRNPYDPARTSGGSSGGAAAALACGMTPLELGSDLAGSIRLPSAFCGVVGLRTTERLLSTRGHGELPGRPRALRSLLVAGPMARRVEDLALALDVLAAPAPRDLEATPAAALRAPALPAVEELRLSWTDELGGLRAAAPIRAALAAFTARLADAGIRVERAAPDVDFAAALELWAIVEGAELRAMLPWALRKRPLRWSLGPATAWRFGRGVLARGIARGFAADMRAYMSARTRRDDVVDGVERFFGSYDAWLCPAAPLTAFTHRRTGAPLEIDGRRHGYGDALGLYLGATAVFGGPIVTLPIGRDPDGLPIGIQLVGPRWADARLLRIARVLEGLGAAFAPPPER